MTASLSSFDVEVMRYARYELGWSVGCIAETMAVHTSTVIKRTASTVEVGRLREAFLASGMSASQVARGLGWESWSGGRLKPEASRVRRTLGVTPESTGKYRVRVDYRIAGRLCEAMGVDPVDVGL